MKYRAIISVDWGAPHNRNEQSAIICALMDAGWLLAETTALILETDDIGKVWQGIDIVAKGSTTAGTLTSLNFNVVASHDFGQTRNYKAKANHPKALQKIQSRAYPKPK